MIFTAADLIFNDYGTSTSYADNDPRISGTPDETILNKREQKEMLYFINYCYEIWNWPEYTKTPGRKIEMLIRTYLMADVRTQQGVLEWISEHWQHYWNLLPTSPSRRR